MSAGRAANGSFSRILVAAAFFLALDATFIRSLRAVKAEDLCVELISPLGYACNDYTLPASRTCKPILKWLSMYIDDHNFCALVNGEHRVVIGLSDVGILVETADGFLLGMYNIPYGRAGPGASPGRPVLLFHGFQAGGDNFVINAAEESLGTILADAGYDVWIGNNRNIEWSKGNTQYGYNDTEYWDWTWDDLAAYDVVSSINFVYSQRGNTPISYVGHSQGCLTFFAALTDNPKVTAQVASQLRSAVLIAPFTYTAHITAPLQNFILSNDIDMIPALLGVGPIDAKSLVITICKQSQMSCDNLISSLVGPDSYLNDTRTSIYLQYFPQVTSSKNYNHYGQIKRSGLFQKYDKGPAANLFSYGQFTPPLYDLSSFPISFPVQIFAGGRDGLADPVDFQTTLSSLPGGLNKEVHIFPNYGHLDFIIGYRAYLDIYPLVLAFLETH